MKKIKRSLSTIYAEFVVKYKWVFVALFVLLGIAAVVMIPQNIVEYDLTSALPKSAESVEGMQVLKDEFDDKGMTYIMFKDVEPSDESRLLAELNGIEGVGSVIYDPSTGYNATTKAMMFTIMLSDYDATNAAFDTMGRINEYAQENGAYITGQSAYTYYTRQETVESIFKIGVVLVIAILIMLFFTSKTYFELVPMLMCFGVAVLLNMGTNFIFGGISYVSNLISLVLQLALSIDYSVILLHRYEEEHDLNPNSHQAIVAALRKGMPEILSSSLTTIAGLASLLLMTLPIGVEIGLSLAKSIICSLASVLFLMPALLSVFHKPIEKSKHKSFVPNVTKPARAIVKARYFIVPLFVIVVALSAVGQFNNVYSFNLNGGAPIVAGQTQFKENFSTLNTFVVIVPTGDYAKEKQVYDYVSSYDIIDSGNAICNIDLASYTGGSEHLYLTDEVTADGLYGMISGLTEGSGFSVPQTMVDGMFANYAEANGLGEVTESTKVPLIDLLVYVINDDTFGALIPADYSSMLSQLTSLKGDEYSRLTFNINDSVEGAETFEFISSVREGLNNYYDEFYLTGESVVCYDMAELFPRDNISVSVFIVVFMLIILFFTFRNWLLPLLLVFAIQGGMWINFVVPFLAGNAMSFVAYLIISAIQMGATIDYAIVLTNRYRTIKPLYVNKLDAMAAAENAVFPTIITSGIILMVAGFTLSIASSGVVSAMGMILGIGVTASMLTVLFVLPSLLLVFDKLVDKAYFRFPWDARPKEHSAKADTDTYTCEECDIAFAEGVEHEIFDDTVWQPKPIAPKKKRVKKNKQ